jgi:triosephosphate isomerase
MRRPLVAANWKMHKGVAEALAFVEVFLPKWAALADAERVEVAIAPPFTALADLRRALGGSGVALAAQNVHDQAQGAFTGEISASMLRDLDCAYAIVGHSERRHLFGESSQFVARKVAALLAAGIRPVVCVGETLEEREAGRTGQVVGQQLRESLAGVGAEAAEELVIAYEPVWAIGTGKTATPAMAQEVHAQLRSKLRHLVAGAAERIRIQYGGSVKPDNAAALMSEPDIDGALVGGASLDPDAFAAIVEAARSG